MRYRIGAFELDVDAFELHRDGERVPLTRKPLQLMLHLVRHRDREVSYAEIFELLWPDAIVSDAAVSSVIRDLRRALGDRGHGSRFVATQRGRGLRFVHEAIELEDPLATATAQLAPQAARPLVGRLGALATFDRALSQVKAGGGSVLLIEGEAGIGKTRLLHELAALGESRGFAVHLGRCLEEEGAPAFWPWIQVLRSVFAQRAPAALRRAHGSAVDEALRLLPEHEGEVVPVQEDGAAARFVLHDAVSRLLCGVARARPRLVVLDDLHRADDASVQLLRHLHREVGVAPILLVGAYRPDEIRLGHSLAALLQDLHASGTRIELAGLERDEVAALVEALAARPALPALADAIHERTAGNPLFVGELTRALDAAGHFDAPDAAAHAIALAPEGVRHVIRGRVALLPADAAEILGCAAVIGRSFDAEILADLCRHLPSDVFRRALDAAIASHLIEPDAQRPAALRFGHILLRDALYEDLAASRRAELHAAVGRSLESLRRADLESHLEELAHHFGQAAAADCAEEAYRYGRAAAEASLARTAYAAAASHAEAALRALDLKSAEAAGKGELDEAAIQRERAELLVLIGNARWRGGSWLRAREAFLDAAAVARRSGDAEMLAEAAFGYAGRDGATVGVETESVALMEEALAALPTADSPLRQRVQSRLASELYHDPDPERSVRLARDALAMAERLGEPVLVADALSALNYVLMRPNVTPEFRAQIAERHIREARRAGSKEQEALGHASWVRDLIGVGDADRLATALHDFDAVAAALNRPFFLWLASAFRGMEAMLGGRLAEAERRVQDAIVYGQQYELKSSLAFYSVQLFTLRREQDRLPELLPLLQQFAEEQPSFAGFRVGIGLAWLASGQREAARDCVHGFAERNFEDVPRDAHWLTALCALAPCVAALNEEQIAAQLVELLHPVRDQLVCAGLGGACHGAVTHALGIYASTCGDLETADEYFEDAAVRHRRLRAPLLLAHTHAEHGTLLWKRGGVRDRVRARELLAAAARSYGEIGLEPRRAWVEAVLGDA